MVKLLHGAQTQEPRFDQANGHLCQDRDSNSDSNFTMPSCTRRWQLVEGGRLGLGNTGCLGLRSRIYALYIRNTCIYHKIHHVCEYVWNQQIQYEKQKIRSMERLHTCMSWLITVTNCIILVHKYCNSRWIKRVIAVLASSGLLSRFSIESLTRYYIW